MLLLCRVRLHYVCRALHGSPRASSSLPWCNLPNGPSYADKPWFRIAGGRSKPRHQPLPGQTEKASCWGQTNREIQTSKSCPGDWKSSRLRDTGVNKNQKVTERWRDMVGAQRRGPYPGPRKRGRLPGMLASVFIKQMQKITYLKGLEVLRFLWKIKTLFILA